MGFRAGLVVVVVIRTFFEDRTLRSVIEQVPSSLGFWCQLAPLLEGKSRRAVIATRGLVDFKAEILN
jgi:hypothetical protein